MRTIQSSRRNHPVAVALFAAVYLALMAFVLMPGPSARAVATDTVIALLE